MIHENASDRLRKGGNFVQGEMSSVTYIASIPGSNDLHHNFLIDSPKSILTYLKWLPYSDRTAPIPRSLLISVMNCFKESYIDGLVQECSISSALAMEILQSCPKIWIWFLLIGTMLHILFESLLTCRGEVEINAVFIQCVPLAAGIHQHPKQLRR